MIPEIMNALPMPMIWENVMGEEEGVLGVDEVGGNEVLVGVRMSRTWSQTFCYTSHSATHPLKHALEAADTRCR